MSERISRRVFLARGVAFGAVAGAVLTVGCGGEETLTCTDVSGLTPAEQAARTGLGYVDASPHGAQKNCLNCNFYQAGAANACGSCTLVKGPIHPSGYCNSWVAKA